MKILCDKNQFLHLWPIISHDKTSKIESALQRRLLALKKQDKPSKMEYKMFRPSGSYRLRLYG